MRKETLARGKKRREEKGFLLLLRRLTAPTKLCLAEFSTDSELLAPPLFHARFCHIFRG